MENRILNPTLKVAGSAPPSGIIKCALAGRPKGVHGYSCNFDGKCESRKANGSTFCGKTPQLEPASKIRSIDELSALLPLVEGKGLWQNKWHPHDVYRHTLEVVRILQTSMGTLGVSNNTLIVAAYLHDIAKPIVAIPNMGKNGMPRYSSEGKPYHSFHNHEKIGMGMVLEMDDGIFRRLGVDREKVAKIVGAHYLPMSYIKMIKKYPEALEITLRAFESDLARSQVRNSDILLLFYADKISTGENATDMELILKLIEYLYNGRSINELRKTLREFYIGQIKEASRLLAK